MSYKPFKPPPPGDGDFIEHLYNVGDHVMTVDSGRGEVRGVFVTKHGDIRYVVEEGGFSIWCENDLKPLPAQTKCSFMVNGAAMFFATAGTAISHTDICALAGHETRHTVRVTWHDPANFDGGPLLLGESVTAREGLYFTVHVR